MKQNLGPGVLIGVVVVILGVVGYFAYRTFFQDPNYSPVSTPEARKQVEEAQHNSATFKRVRGRGAHAN